MKLFMEITIRPILEKDNLSLAKIIRRVFEEHNAPQTGTIYSDPTTDNLYKLFQTPGSAAFVAEYNNEIIGCCGIYPTEGLRENCVELVKFHITKSARGMGIGKELMQKCIDSAKNLGYTQMYLESLAQFERAVCIYEKQGFVRLHKPLGNSGHGSCNIWMLKKL
jgi:putative acetyltransferase